MFLCSHDHDAYCFLDYFFKHRSSKVLCVLPLWRIHKDTIWHKDTHGAACVFHSHIYMWNVDPSRATMKSDGKNEIVSSVPFAASPHTNVNVWWMMMTHVHLLRVHFYFVNFFHLQFKSTFHVPLGNLHERNITFSNLSGCHILCASIHCHLILTFEYFMEFGLCMRWILNCSWSDRMIDFSSNIESNEKHVITSDNKTKKCLTPFELKPEKNIQFNVIITFCMRWLLATMRAKVSIRILSLAFNPNWTLLPKYAQFFTKFEYRPFFFYQLIQW